MSKRILIIEDEKDIARMYKIKFEQIGYTVELAPDGKQGFEKAKSFLPDVILLDVIMPEENGLSMLKRLKDDATMKSIPVFLASNLGKEEEAREGRALGAVDYLIKANMTPAQLVQKVDSEMKRT
jgi:DNA-binding response OmpR family regulator